MNDFCALAKGHPMKSSRKKLLGVVILLLFLVPLGVAVKKVYRELRQPDLNASLIAAVKRSDTAEVVALLSQGADGNARDLPPDTRSMWLRLWDRLRGKPLPTDYPSSALLVALENDFQEEAPPENVPLVKALLNAQAAVNDVDESGRTPLMWAAILMRRETVRLLLERGANVNARETHGYTTLHYSAEQSDPSLVQLLLARGANVNARNKFKATPVHSAVIGGQANILRLLLDAGGDTEARDIGRTPISVAARRKEIDCVRILLAKGASANTKDSSGDTPLKWARYYHYTDMISTLIKAGAKE